jgi:hypothetical protein
MTNRCLRPIAGPVGLISESQPSWSDVTNSAELVPTDWLISEDKV